MSDPTEGTETSTLEDSLSAAFDGATPSDDSASQQATAPGSPASGELKPLEPPKHWSEADRTLFGSAPRNIQERWVSREQEIARGLDAKFQEVAGFRKEREDYDRLLSPYKRDLELQGVQPTQFLGALLGWHKYLQDNPREGLQRLAQAYGIDPKSLTEAVQDNPQIAKVLGELNQVKTEFGAFRNEAQQRENQANLSRVEAFADAKGADGKLMHPYFDEVADDIRDLMHAQRSRGQAPDLEACYMRAIRMNEKVFEKVQMDARAKKDADTKASVDKAKRAAVTNGSGQSQGSTRKLTLEEELAARFDGTLN